MAHEALDITHNPDLLRLAEEVRASNTPRVLRRDNEDVAVVMPLADTGKRKAPRSPFKPKSQADIDAFLSSAGGWKELVDTEQLKRDIYQSRARSGRPAHQPMSYLLDSDVTADYLKGLPQTVQQIQPLVTSGIGISIITYGEVYDGIVGSYDPKAAERVFRQFLRVAIVLPLNRAVMRRFATERRILRLSGRKLDDMDMLIAATALHYNLTLITRNVRHFSRIHGLVWQQP